MCIPVCVHVFVSVSEGMCGGERSTLGILIYHSRSYFLEIGKGMVLIL